MSMTGIEMEGKIIAHYNLVIHIEVAQMPEENEMCVYILFWCATKQLIMQQGERSGRKWEIDRREDGEGDVDRDKDITVYIRL